MSTGIRTTQAGVTDVDAVLVLLESQFAEHEIQLAPGVLHEALLKLVTDPSLGAVLIASDGARPIGLAVLALTWTLERGGLVAWLDELYVVADRRGEGIGTALLGDAVAVAREAGCAALELEVESSHSRAEKLYEASGFQRLRRTRWVRALSGGLSGAGPQG